MGKGRRIYAIIYELELKSLNSDDRACREGYSSYSVDPGPDENSLALSEHEASNRPLFSLSRRSAQTMRSILSLLVLAGPALAASRTTAPSGCVTVAKSGGQYSTIQAAVNSGPQCIFIAAGTYNEQVLVQKKLIIYGATSDTSSYSGNQVTITANKSQKDGLGNDATATLRVKANGFKMYNVNVNNGFGQGSQAVALSAYADSGYFGCKFTGFQDTLLSQEGTHVFAKCLIAGATDFIFGQHAKAWFEKCDIRVVSASLGYITGQSC